MMPIEKEKEKDEKNLSPVQVFKEDIEFQKRNFDPCIESHIVKAQLQGITDVIVQFYKKIIKAVDICDQQCNAKRKIPKRKDICLLSRAT